MCEVQDFHHHSSPEELSAVDVDDADSPRSSTMQVILDVQGFIGPRHDFIPKELSVIEIFYKKIPLLARALFKPPCAWEDLPVFCKSINGWLKRNHHGFDWNCGDIPYSEMLRFVNDVVEDACCVFVKGPEKKSWLECVLMDKTKPVIDLSSLNCPNLEELREKFCVTKWHEDDHGNVPNYSCAFENVQRLRGWYVKHCRDKEMEEEMANQRRCERHYCSMNDDQFDGPIPMVKNCVLCQKDK